MEIDYFKIAKENNDDLCDFCPLLNKGVSCYGGEPIYCSDSGMCEKAYQNYIDYKNGKIKDIDKEIKKQIKQQELESEKFIEINDLNNEKRQMINNGLNNINDKLKVLFDHDIDQMLKRIKHLKGLIISSESASLFNDIFGSVAKRDGANISIITNDILEKNKIKKIELEIKKLEKEKKLLEQKRNEYETIHIKEVYENANNFYNKKIEELNKFYKGVL